MIYRNWTELNIASVNGCPLLEFANNLLISVKVLTVFFCFLDCLPLSPWLLLLSPQGMSVTSQGLEGSPLDAEVTTGPPMLQSPIMRYQLLAWPSIIWPQSSRLFPDSTTNCRLATNCQCPDWQPILEPAKAPVGTSQPFWHLGRSNAT